MAILRAAVAVLAASCLVVGASPASAASLDDCAQRVIRDWYAGARVDEVYRLGCYRAAIRALPEDVRQYSDAESDIAHALAHARRELAGTANSPARPGKEGVRPARSASSPKAPNARRTPRNGQDAPAVRLASEPLPQTPSEGLPYPVLVLAALSGVLFLSAAVGWLMARRS